MATHLTHRARVVLAGSVMLLAITGVTGRCRAGPCADGLVACPRGAATAIPPRPTPDAPSAGVTTVNPPEPAPDATRDGRASTAPPPDTTRNGRASTAPPPTPDTTRPGLASIEPLDPIPGGVTGAACARVTLTAAATTGVAVTVISSDPNTLRVLGNFAVVPDGRATAVVRCDTASPPGPVAITLSAFLGADSASTVVTVL